MKGETEYNQPWIAQRADPYVIKAADGSYYFTASVPEYDRIILRHSATFEGLAEAAERVLWRKHESGPMSRFIWAPELHLIDGGWYIYFAAGEAEDEWKIRPYVLHCTGNDPMQDAWEECGALRCAAEDEFSFRAFSLDVTIFSHRDTWYCVWAEKVGVGRMISNLYIAKLASPTCLDTVQVLLTTPDYDWERIGYWVNEGPALLKKNGKLFLTFSASETGAVYCVGLLEASEDADLLDPASWKKSRYPVLASDAEKGIYGPGHNSFTVSDDGKQDLMVYHARTYADIEGDPLFDPNRNAMWLVVDWDADGRPVFPFRRQSA